MDRRPLIKNRLNTLLDTRKDLSVCEILYSILREENLYTKPEGAATGFLLKTDDADLYQAILRTMENEPLNELEDNG